MHNNTSMVLCIWYQLLSYVLALSYTGVCMLMAVCTHNQGMCPYIHANAHVAGYLAALTAFLIIAIMFATCLLTHSFACCNSKKTSAFDHMECGSDSAREECMHVWDRSHREMRSGDMMFPIFVIVWFVLTMVGAAYGVCGMTGRCAHFNRSDSFTGTIVVCLVLFLFVTVLAVCHPCIHCTPILSRRSTGVARQTSVVPHVPPPSASMVRHELPPTSMTADACDVEHPPNPVDRPPISVVIGIPSQPGVDIPILHATLLNASPPERM